MPTNVLKQMLDAGVEFSQMNRQRAERIVKEMVRAGEVRVDDAQTSVQELLDHGRESTERFSAAVQREVQRQLHALGVATRADIARLERKIDKVAKASSKAAKAAPSAKAPPKRSAKPEPGKTAAKKRAAGAKKAAK